MENQKEHFRHILFYYFRKGKNAVQAHKKLRDVYGEDALKLRQCQNWFTKFRSRDFNVKDAPRSGRPIEIDDDKIKALIDSNRRLTTRESAENLNVLKSSVEIHLKRLGYISKLDIWILLPFFRQLHDSALKKVLIFFSKKQFQQRFDILISSQGFTIQGVLQRTKRMVI
ncbi:Histone-lysine N-methyltransferase SETMAR [Ooceraea biroi]|uniref:Histone-lysine N-methyltransferase SETMAR n=1 Tax=Ooceraea biroi TaxID=2015173 RepID=A0A026VSU4_OOCBI|nr:Histone-lysine N-methyltransferase SETMAR [Ooceraea biroi]